jgi:ABC-2 type transport system ATP-binding protein
MPEPAIYVQKLRKVYSTVVAVDDLSLEVPRGEIFGLLGPNGAGKTTTIRMLMDIIKPDSGEARVLGMPPGQSRTRVGYLPEERGLYRTLRVAECLAYLGELKGMKLGDWGKRKVDELSRGMQQKVQLIASIIHDPELVILDEPFQGLDPVNAEMVRGVIRDLRAQGKTVVLSAHEMSLVEMLCERIALINRGRVLLDGNLAQIKQRFAPNAIEISPALPLEGWPGVAHVAAVDGRQRITLDPGAQPRDLLQQIVERGLPLEQYQRATATLDEIFITVVKGDVDHAPL